MHIRSDWVDYAKAIGIVLVVYGHVAGGLFSAGIEKQSGIVQDTVKVVYSFHMPLFFFLSGLFFQHSFSRRGGVQLVMSKIDTIVYPYMVWSILQGGIEVLLSNYTNRDLVFSDVLALWDPRAQFWFLYALFFVFVTGSVIYSFCSERYGLLIFVLACLLYLGRAHIPFIKPIMFVSNNFVYFMFGIIFTKYGLGKAVSTYSALFLTAFAFVAVQFFMLSYADELHAFKNVVALFAAFVSIVFVASLSIAVSKYPNRFFAFIGTSSMAIYVMHVLAGSGVRVFLSKILGVDSVFVHLFFGCLAGVLLPLMALKVIDSLKIPYVFSAPISKWLALLYNKRF